jgi:hypothetical protein
MFFVSNLQSYSQAGRRGFERAHSARRTARDRGSIHLGDDPGSRKHAFSDLWRRARKQRPGKVLRAAKGD